MRGRFYKARSKLAQATNVSRPLGHHPKLSKEYRASLNARRKESVAKYHAALNEAWDGLDKTIARIAEEHNKSVRRVESDLHFSRPVSLKQHSKRNAWNAFFWKKCQEEKENVGENGA